MNRKNIRFTGRHGELAGAMELPAGTPRGFALFAHCFTYGKDSLAAARISRQLASHGIAVLRFDFTGLGGSDGDFANSNFSGNIEDLVAAADYLRDEHAAPTLLIGHSLGGTAVLAAAGKIEEAKAVVTIAAPSSPEHVISHFDEDSDALEDGKAREVSIGGRSFRIDRSFIEDLRQHSMRDRIRKLRKALLIMHSPIDSVVEIAQAAAIFEAALHPKSFVSLDDADHLLRRAADAEFAASTIAGWANRYFPADAQSTTATVAAGTVLVTERSKQFLRHVRTDDHDWLADEPERAGGENLGPDPYEQLLASLGTCTSMTIRMYANRKQWPLDDVRIELTHERDHGADCERCEEPGQIIEVIKRVLTLTGELDDSQRKRLLEIADRCPVHKTLTGELQIETELVADGT